MQNTTPRVQKRREEDVCLAHSGNENRAKLMLALLILLIGLLTTMGGSMMMTLTDVKTNVATITANQAAVTYRFEVGEASRSEIKETMRDIHRRVTLLEKFEYGHVEKYASPILTK